MKVDKGAVRLQIDNSIDGLRAYLSAVNIRNKCKVARETAERQPRGSREAAERQPRGSRETAEGQQPTQPRRRPHTAALQSPASLPRPSLPSPQHPLFLVLRFDSCVGLLYDSSRAADPARPRQHHRQGWLGLP